MEPAALPSSPWQLGLGRLFHTIRDAVIVADAADGRILLWNSAASRLLGYTAEEARGITIDAIVPERLVAAHRAGRTRYAATGHGALIDGGKPVEVAACHRDGAEVPIELTLSALDDVPASGRLVLAILRDLSERRRLEQERAQALLEAARAEERVRLQHVSQQHGRELALAADVGIAITGDAPLQTRLQFCAEAIVLHLDAAFARIWTLEKPTGILHLQASAGIYTHLNGAHSRVALGAQKIGRIALERRPHLTNQVVGDPGVVDQDWAVQEGMVAFAGYPLVAGDEVMGVVALFARHALASSAVHALAPVANGIALTVKRSFVEAEREAALVRESVARTLAEQAVRQRDEFLSVAAHELKTPLTGLRGFAQLLRRRSEREGSVSIQRARPMLEHIDHQTLKLARLIDQLLDISRLEAGRLRLEPGDADLMRIVEEAIAAVRGDDVDRAFHFSGPAHVFLRGDALRLEQVCTNLLRNAMKYSPAGKPIELTVEADADVVRMAVRDYGPGIAAEDRVRIFDRFHRLAVNHQVEGMGLGLFISRQIAEMHSGTLNVEAPADGGARFILILPLHTG